MKSLKEERLGLVMTNNQGSRMKVIEYNGANDVTVQFECGEIVKTIWGNVKSGSVKSVYDKVIYGVGYIGEGTYTSNKIVDGKKVKTEQYQAWHSMMRRCYSSDFHDTNQSYILCTVSPVWHNFQNFATWYDYNYYKVPGEKMCLDKDILVKGNKRYSPATCVFAPDTINNIVLKRDSRRGSSPIGVTKNPRKEGYIAQISKRRLGDFLTPEEAFEAYKQEKEKQIKDVAEKYKHHIPAKLYEALLRYEVEIDD